MKNAILLATVTLGLLAATPATTTTQAQGEFRGNAFARSEFRGNSYAESEFRRNSFAEAEFKGNAFASRATVDLALA